MEKNDFFLKRIRELADLSYQRDIVTFSDFLNLNEQNMVNSLRQQFPQIIVESSGGYANAERQMVAFHPDALAFTWEYPIEIPEIFRRTDPQRLSGCPAESGRGQSHDWGYPGSGKGCLVFL